MRPLPGVRRHYAGASARSQGFPLKGRQTQCIVSSRFPLKGRQTPCLVSSRFPLNVPLKGPSVVQVYRRRQPFKSRLTLDPSGFIHKQTNERTTHRDRSIDCIYGSSRKYLRQFATLFTAVRQSIYGSSVRYGRAVRSFDVAIDSSSSFLSTLSICLTAGKKINLTIYARQSIFSSNDHSTLPLCNRTPFSRLFIDRHQISHDNSTHIGLQSCQVSSLYLYPFLRYL